MKSSICSSHITYVGVVRVEAGKVGRSQTLEALEQKAEELRFYVIDGETTFICYSRKEYF